MRRLISFNLDIYTFDSRSCLYFIFYVYYLHLTPDLSCFVVIVVVYLMRDSFPFKNGSFFVLHYVKMFAETIR